LATRAQDATAALARGNAGWSDVVKLAAQWVLGRPSLYSIPSSIPALRLGEMIYHPPHPPREMSRAARTILRTALRLDDDEIASRRSRADELSARAAEGQAFSVVTPVRNGAAGYLRLAVLDRTGRAATAPRSGVLRGYPITLDQHEMSPTVLLAGEKAGHGAQRLRDRLFTLPVHSRMNAGDVRGVAAWLAADHPVRT
jgi:hypothetical protein